MRLFDDSGYWVQVSDGNLIAFSIFQRHYSYRKHRRTQGKNGKRIAGPGETIILIGKDSKALFVWKKQKYNQDGQSGVNCTVFRNESTFLSSELLREAEEIAVARWPGQRLFTYVNPRKIKSKNPGYCFKVHGWKQCGISKTRKLIILEKSPFFVGLWIWPFIN